MTSLAIFRTALFYCCIANGTYAFVASPASPIKCTESCSGLRRTPTQNTGSIRGTHHYQRHDAVSLASSPGQQGSDDPRVEPRTIHQVDLNLPLGIILEEMDLSDPSYGVVITGINEGNAADYNANIFTKIKSQDKSIDASSEKCICIRDKIMSVNGTPCHDKSFDDVIGLISSTESNNVSLEIGRPEGSTVVNYSNGICIAAKPGESYGFLAGKCGIDIDYECRTGNCQTCTRWMEFPDKARDLTANEGGGSLYERTILHCVGKMPRGYHWLHVLDPYSGSNDDIQGDG